MTCRCTWWKSPKLPLLLSSFLVIILLLRRKAKGVLSLPGSLRLSVRCTKLGCLTGFTEINSKWSCVCVPQETMWLTTWYANIFSTYVVSPLDRVVIFVPDVVYVVHHSNLHKEIGTFLFRQTSTQVRHFRTIEVQTWYCLYSTQCTTCWKLKAINICAFRFEFDEYSLGVTTAQTLFDIFREVSNFA